MATVSRLLGFVAKLGLDLLIGSKRTDEAVALVKGFFQDHPEEDPKKQATDDVTVKEAVQKAAKDAHLSLAEDEVTTQMEAVKAGLELIVQNGTETVAERLVKQLVKRRGTYAIWIDLAEIVGKGEPGRYVHFFWNENGSYTVRDFIGGSDFSEEELKRSAERIWQESRARIPCLTVYGLRFPTTKREEWTRVLLLLTEAARLWGAPRPNPMAS